MEDTTIRVNCQPVSRRATCPEILTKQPEKNIL